MDWNETKTIMLEVEQLFNRGDELRDIVDITKMQQEIESHHIDTLNNAKDIIKVLTNQITIKESEVLAPADSAHSAQLHKLQQEKENVSNQIQNLQEWVDQRREATMKMASECLKVSQNLLEFDEATTLSETRTLYALSLYNKITGITWEFNSPMSISGVISCPEKSEMKNFKIQKQESNSFEVANKLWELIELNQ